MKIRTSYFYQIRNFLPHMIPVSTALSDPEWFHQWQGPAHTFHDKRGILNGVRYEYIMVQKNCPHECPCESRQPHSCTFLTNYRAELEKLDFERIMRNFNYFCNKYAQEHQLEEEPILVLIVHEALNNPCSERAALIDYFNAHGVECKELDYPIGGNENE